MGTRGITKVFDASINHKKQQKNIIINLYRQYDSYLTCHGKELSEFLLSGVLVYGYTDKKTRQFNGMGCLAAQLVTEFKKGVGNFYLYPTKMVMDCWQEFEYFVYSDGVEVYDSAYNKDSVPIFIGSYLQFSYFIKKHLDAETKRRNNKDEEVY